jgi:hypothetical protein
MMIRTFRLSDKPDELGLSFTEAGVALAGVPLVYKTRGGGFGVRPDWEMAALLSTAYGADPTRLRSSLIGIAQAFNSGDFARAAIAAVQTRTPELNPEAAARLENAAEILAKKYNADEPRDWHGRWTSDGSADQSDPRQQAANQSVVIKPVVLADAQDDGADEPQDSTSLQQAFEKKYDDLGPVDFAKQVIEFGDWLGREGKNLSTADGAHALAEYSFVQDRLSFWLAYDYKPPTAQNNLLSAALTLYQGAVNAGIVHADEALPHSMLYVGGATGAFENAPPRISMAGLATEESLPPVYVPKEVQVSGDLVDDIDAGMWNAGIKEQGNAWEVYNARVDPDAEMLMANSKTFDLFNGKTGEAISAKTLNTLSVSYITNPYKIYQKMMGYINEAADYEPYKDSDLNPEKISMKTVHLAIPEYTSPTQWRYIYWAIVDGKMSGIRVVITRIRE